MSLFDIAGLDEFTDTMKMVSEVYPKEVKRFMQREGNKLKKKTVETVKSSTLGKITGNYEKGIKRGRYYKYDGNGADSIRVYSSAPHAHLIEYGHEIVHSGGGKGGGKRRRKMRKELYGTGKYTRAFQLFRRAADEFESVYETDCEKFALKIIEPLNNS